MRCKIKSSFCISTTNCKITELLAETPLVRPSVRGAEVSESEQLEAKRRYRGVFVTREMPLEYAKLSWRRYLTDGTKVKAISTLW